MSQYDFPEDSYYEYAKYLKGKVPADIIDDIWALHSRKTINMQNLYRLDTKENVCDLKSLDENTLNVDIKRKFETINEGNYLAEFKEAKIPYFNDIVYLYYEINQKMEIAIPLNYQENAYITFYGTGKTVALGNESYTNAIKENPVQTQIVKATTPSSECLLMR